MSKASPDSAKTFKLFIRAPVAVLMSGTIYRRIQKTVSLVVTADGFWEWKGKCKTSTATNCTLLTLHL